ncbi:hypothetical protein Egran_01466 [Elaphomyces granulatus]|uniref:Uncharacterized protein n=1 Tax=Elaphomyces granulatus TaxID=519963 RepID=A0A232M337_9EURO|nr:hypothetical protein Egran_01466 [Elaphomyces granulatus]
MPRYPPESESSSDYSESDVSVDKRAYVKKKRSTSRHRNHRDTKAYLVPAPVQRSASTGGRRSRREQQPPTVVVDINNDMTSRHLNKDRTKVTPKYYGEVADTSEKEVRSHRRHRASSTVSSRTPSPYQRDWEMVVDQRLLKNNDTRQDFELMKHEQEIGAMKHQQEIERLERLLSKDREPHREPPREVQLVRQEEDYYDDDVNEKLRKKLDRQERKKQLEEERRLIELREKAKKLEERERLITEEDRAKRLTRDQQLQELEKREKEKSEVDRKIRDRQYHDLEKKEREKSDLERLLRDRQLHDLEKKEKEKYDLDRLVHEQQLRELEKKEKERVDLEKLTREQKFRELERREKDKAERDRIRKEIKDEEARRELEEQELKKEQDKIRAAAIEEYKRVEERKRMEALREKEKRDREFNGRLKALGYTDEQIDGIVNKRKKEEMEKMEQEKERIEKMEREKREKEKRERERREKEKREREEDIDVRESETKITYIKVNRKYLLPDTLNAYRLPWEWDEVSKVYPRVARDGNYIIIKTYVSKELQEELFAHTRRLREPKLITEQSSSLTELKVNDKNKDKLYLVRKKSPAPSRRRSWILS